MINIPKNRYEAERMAKRSGTKDITDVCDKCKHWSYDVEKCDIMDVTREGIISRRLNKSNCINFKKR